MRNTDLNKIYDSLLSSYGPQGWWPILSYKGINPTKTGSMNGYHPGNFSFPKNAAQKFEICAGAILTQNTSWPQVEKALLNLKEARFLDPETIAEIDADDLKPAIKPAGYFNQKAEYLKTFAIFFLSLKKRKPSREDVLSVKGIGDETADSILLYAFKQPEFVVDAYTKRIFYRLGLTGENAAYQELKDVFEKNLKKNIELFQEYHALIVEHAKRHCKKKPECKSCPIAHMCKKKI
ncbi:MAG: endonuclease III domain-containing protein [Nanoarchaeota archaeon]|nr:endonuclease III domain-containing protein [Nanoarchaeota archaeon]